MSTKSGDNKKKVSRRDADQGSQLRGLNRKLLQRPSALRRLPLLLRQVRRRLRSKLQK